jgi:uracil-DNA glycosylase
MNKKEQYDALVGEAAACRECDKYCVTKGDERIVLDHDPERRHINLWTEWQCSLDAEIMLIGQDFGYTTLEAARACEKRMDEVKQYLYSDPSKNAQTDKNLCRLFMETFGIDILPRDDRLFFTNSVLCYKTGNPSNPVHDKWFELCNTKFIKRLLDIIRPKVVIVMSKLARQGLLYCGTATDFNGNVLEKGYFNRTTTAIVDDGPFVLTISDGHKITVAPVFHTSPLTQKYRNRDQQLNDWRRIAAVLRDTANEAVRV